MAGRMPLKHLILVRIQVPEPNMFQENNQFKIAFGFVVLAYSFYAFVLMFFLF